MKTTAVYTKRILDIFISLIAILTLLPFIVLIALAVRLTSPGPIIFRQKRLGWQGKHFQLWKFRTMYVNTPDLRNADGSTYNSAHDPRVTPIGRFLRSSSLDELPQLFNVLLGEMSLVGPRPDLVDQLRYYDSWALTKLRVKPGLTGYAQVKYRQSASWQQRLELDIQYAENWSIFWDLALMIQTVPRVLSRQAVYLDSNPDPATLPSMLQEEKNDLSNSSTNIVASVDQL